MRVVIDGTPVRGTSLGIVVENLLKGWDQLGTDDDVHLVVSRDAHLDLPSSVSVHAVDIGRPPFAGRLWAQNVMVPRLCRRVHATVMLGVTPATTISPLPCRRAIIALDLRHERRPEQFSGGSRLLRRSSYAIGYRQADGIACISERTRRDLLDLHPWLRRRRVEVALLGADHVLSWPAAATGDPFALAFGQWTNKNVDLVIEAWSLLRGHGEALPLVLVGVPTTARPTLQAEVERLDLSDVVTIKPWMDPSSFHQQFASASLVVFPSDYEGFGLPAVEAMRLGIPVVVTPDPALLEVTDGLATVMDGWDAAALARAVPSARRIAAEDLARATSRASEFTWRRTAAATRYLLEQCGTPTDRTAPRPD